MGLIPHLFEKLKLNNNKNSRRIPSNHSKSSRFIDRPSKTIYSKSIIVNDIAPKTMGENFTFIDNNELDYNN